MTRKPEKAIRAYLFINNGFQQVIAANSWFSWRLSQSQRAFGPNSSKCVRKNLKADPLFIN